MRGPSAASTRGGASAGATDVYGAASMSSRYDARYDRGLPYECLRTRSTSAGLLTPSPSRNLPGNASASDFWQADIVTASRAYTFAMPVATFSVDVSDKS